MSAGWMPFWSTAWPPGGRFALSGPAFSRETAGIPTRKSAPELHQAIEKALTELRADGTLKRISEKWFGADVTQ